MDASDVKMINGYPLEDSSKDAEISKLIELYTAIAEDYCNQKFDDKSTPSGVKKFVAECIKYGSTGNISARTMGTVSYTFVTDIPTTIYKYLNPYRRLRWGGYGV
ncbi:TPA: phage head-tail connector protein [Staphylococcus aureus]